jgi:hypothetical protein
MKRSTLMIALGEKPPKEEADAEMSEDMEATDDEGVDDAIDLALDPEADPAVRREAFRRAVKGCGY